MVRERLRADAGVRSYTGQAVEIVFDPVTPEITLPRFRRVARAGESPAVS